MICRAPSGCDFPPCHSPSCFCAPMLALPLYPKGPSLISTHSHVLPTSSCPIQVKAAGKIKDVELYTEYRHLSAHVTAQSGLQPPACLHHLQKGGCVTLSYLNNVRLAQIFCIEFFISHTQKVRGRPCFASPCFFLFFFFESFFKLMDSVNVYLQMFSAAAVFPAQSVPHEDPGTQ